MACVEKKTLLIVGASGHGKVLAECAEAAGWQQVVFADDKYPQLTNVTAGNKQWPVMGVVDFSAFDQHKYQDIALAVGNSELRQQWFSEAENHGFNLPAIIHPSASVSPSATIGKASVVFPLAVINAAASVGQAVIVNSSSVIEHDCVVGNFTHVSPNASLAGAVTVGARCWIGLGANVIQCLTIADDVILGAGAAVTQSINNAGTYVGIPAKPVKNL